MLSKTLRSWVPLIKEKNKLKKKSPPKQKLLSGKSVYGLSLCVGSTFAHLSSNHSFFDLRIYLLTYFMYLPQKFEFLLRSI